MLLLHLPGVETMNSLPSIALSGMNAAQDQMSNAANDIANANTEGFRRREVRQQELTGGGTGTAVEVASRPGEALATDMVGLLQGKNALLANLAVFRTRNRMLGALLDDNA
jgi:flagellar basal body rod protein FlgC